jgi:nucleoside-diphosphate-sugar epimerase
MVLDETAPLGVHLHRWSYYSRAKVEAHRMVLDAHSRGDVSATIIHPSWLYGERDRASMPRMIRAIRNGKAKIIGDGSNRLNLTYAGNEAEGCVLAANSPKAAGQSYNIASDGVITQQEYSNKIAACIGARPVTRKVPYRVAYSAAFLMELFGHITHRKSPPLVTRYAVWLMGRRCFFSTEKIQRELGYKPSVGYDEGITRAVKWAIDHAGA